MGRSSIEDRGVVTFPKPTVITLAVLAALLAIVLVARHAMDRPKPPAARFAQAILAGRAQARGDLAEEAGDHGLADDEAAAGAMWAKAHGAVNRDECPLDPPALRRGCAAYVAAHAR